jgi:hypothetical protein
VCGPCGNGIWPGIAGAAASAPAPSTDGRHRRATKLVGLVLIAGAFFWLKNDGDVRWINGFMIRVGLGILPLFLFGSVYFAAWEEERRGAGWRWRLLFAASWAPRVRLARLRCFGC